MAPEPIWTVLEKRKFLASAGIRTPDRPNHSDWAILAQYINDEFHNLRCSQNNGSVTLR
jgi:hypothetical protein